MNILLTAINAKYIHTNLAINSIFAYCKKDFGNHLTVREFTINNEYEFIISEIYLEKPDIVCFSCYIWNIEIVTKIAQVLKVILPNIKIILGGPEVSYDAKYLSYADIIVIGEGEETFRSLIDYFINSEINISDIDGIAYNENSKIVYTKERKPLNLAEIPFIYDKMNGVVLPENKIIYYETSRGCPYNCQFCLSSATNGVRFSPVSKIFKELDFFLEKRVRQVKFVDRTFNCDIKRAEAIWKHLICNDNGVTNFHFEISADLLNDDIIEKLKPMRPGLCQFEIGVQSTNSDTLSEVKRQSDIAKLISVVQKLQKNNNIELHLDLIAGLPNEDLQSFRRSFNDIYALNPTALQLGFLKLLKGSGLRYNAKKLGIVYQSHPPYEVLYTNALSYEQLMLLKHVHEMLDMYYNSTQFVSTLQFAVPFYSSPFDFYKELADFWRSNDYHLKLHSRMQQFSILYEFLKTSMENDDFINYLKYDLYRSENIKTLPYWLKEDKFIEKRRFFDDKNCINKYLPHYIEKTSSQLSRLCNIVRFGKDNKTYLLFDYGVWEKSVMHSNAKAAVHHITNEMERFYD